MANDQMTTDHQAGSHCFNYSRDSRALKTPLTGKGSSTQFS